MRAAGPIKAGYSRSATNRNLCAVGAATAGMLFQTNLGQPARTAVCTAFHTRGLHCLNGGSAETDVDGANGSHCCRYHSHVIEHQGMLKRTTSYYLTHFRRGARILIAVVAQGRRSPSLQKRLQFPAIPCERSRVNLQIENHLEVLRLIGACKPCGKATSHEESQQRLQLGLAEWRSLRPPESKSSGSGPNTLRVTKRTKKQHIHQTKQRGNAWGGTPPPQRRDDWRL